MAFPSSRGWAALPSGRVPAGRKPAMRPAPPHAFRSFGCCPPPGPARQVARCRPPPLPGESPEGFGACLEEAMRQASKRSARRDAEAPRANLYDEVTAKIIAQLEA